MFKKCALIALMVALTVSVVAAEEPKPAEKPTYTDRGPEEKLPVPRFVTLGTDEVNLRTGPGLRYPIKIIVRKDGLPVEVVHEFDVWRKVRDIEGTEGWVHKSMLSGRRSVIIKGHVQPLLKKPEDSARPVVKLEPGVIATLELCKESWCKLDISSYEGWIKRDNLWGIYPDEKFED